MESKAAVLQDLNVLQRMVDMRITSLEGLRKEGSSGSGLIQHEIRTVEGKLMKLFSKQLSTIYKNQDVLCLSDEETSRYPQLHQFLYVVGVESEIKENILASCNSIQELCALSDGQLKQFCNLPPSDTDYDGENSSDCDAVDGISPENDQFLPESEYSHSRRLIAALKLLQTYSDHLKKGEKANDLLWESWNKSGSDFEDREFPFYDDNIPEKSKSLSLPSTMKYSSRSIPPSPILFTKNEVSIPRSKSDEANVGHRVHLDSSSSSTTSASGYSTGKGLGTRPQPLNLIVTNTNGCESTSTENDGQSNPPSVSHSPRTPTRLFHFGMGHSIKHIFSAKTFLISLACEYCHRLMFVGVKCKECGFKCHKKCSRKAPPSCGLPPALEKIFRDTLRSSDGNAFKFYTLPNMKRTVSDPSSMLQVDKDRPKRLTANRSHGDLAAHAIDQRSRICSENYYANSTMSQSGDSCSTTSSASSDPSSPAVADSPNDAVNKHNVPYYMTPIATDEHFIFPGDDNPVNELINSTTETETSTLTGTMRSNMSTDTIVQTQGSSVSKSSSGTKSSESTISETDDFAVDNLDTQISDVIPPRLRNRGERGSLMSEWVIPFDDIELKELIGKGRMGRVHKARWHGEVAVKILHVENPSEKEKSAFKYKVQTFRKTRHENLILFMGACMYPPTLAIVTSLCKGLTLHQHVHEQNNTFDTNRIIAIIAQVAQGMGYLHARGIVHKDLNSKNIFVEKHRIVITDFGLLNVADTRSPLERPGWLLITANWLCYQAPEIMRALDPLQPGSEVHLYTKETDIYAFGTVWYELLTTCWPFEDQPTDGIIWQVGKGFKQPLSKLEVSRDAKDILSMCWAYNPDHRPQFYQLTKAFERLPKKKLIRSPSQPMYTMSRSADALVLY